MSSRGTSEGFTLLEALVALAILALVLGSVLATFGNGLRTAEAAGTRFAALAKAQDLMAYAEDGAFAPGVHEATEPPFTWELRVEPEPPHGPTGLLPTRLSVQVSWDDGRRSLQLKSRMLAPPGGGAAP